MPSPPRPDTNGAGEDIALRYLGQAELALRGAFSGKVYRVGPGRRRVLVDQVDADTLVRSGLFQTA